MVHQNDSRGITEPIGSTVFAVGIIKGTCMETLLYQSANGCTEAVRKVDIRMLVSQLTFLKVLVEGFDFLAKDCCNGLQIIADLCALRAKDFKRLGLDDEADLLIHLRGNMTCSPYRDSGQEPSFEKKPMKSRCFIASRLCVSRCNGSSKAWNQIMEQGRVSQ